MKGLHALAVALSAASLLSAAPARAQPRAVLVLVPEAAPEAMRDALAVELQLAGWVVELRSAELAPDRRAVVELGAHAEREVIVIAPAGGDALVVARVAPGGRRIEERIDGTWSSIPPRAAALLSVALLEAPADDDAERAPAPSPAAPTAPPPEIRTEAPARSDAGPLALRAPREPAISPRRRVSRRPAVAPRPPSADSPSRDERIAFELLGAAIAGGALGTAGALIAALASEGADPFPYWSYGLAIGGAIGAVAGVLIAGSLAGGDGDALWTIVAGFAAGALSAGLIGLGQLFDTDPLDGVDPAFTFLGTFTAIALPPALAVLAFELTQ